jgi:hypothetical protein
MTEYKPRLAKLNITSRIYSVHHLDDQTIIETEAFTLIIRQDESEVADIFCSQGFETMKDITLSIGEPIVNDDLEDSDDD